MDALNHLRWNGGPGHYEVWFLTFTDRGSDTGLWIRFTLHAPVAGAGEPHCELWFGVMHPGGRRLARRARFPAAALRAEGEPFRLHVDEAELSARGSAGAFDDVRWELRWEPGDDPGLPVHPLIERARLARTMLVIPQPCLRIEGTVAIGGDELCLTGAGGAQAHLWGTKHASSWGWAHAADLETTGGEPCPGDWLDAVSVTAPRLGRQIGPSTSVVGRVLGEPFRGAAPLSVARARAESTLTRYAVRAQAGARRLVLETVADRGALLGVTYEDPDGDLLRCWNSEIATLRCQVWDRAGRHWTLRETLAAPGRGCFEYAQRGPIAGLPMHVGGP